MSQTAIVRPVSKPIVFRRIATFAEPRWGWHLPVHRFGRGDLDSFCPCPLRDSFNCPAFLHLLYERRSPVRFSIKRCPSYFLISNEIENQTLQTVRSRTLKTKTITFQLPLDSYTQGRWTHEQKRKELFNGMSRKFNAVIENVRQRKERYLI